MGRRRCPTPSHGAPFCKHAEGAKLGGVRTGTYPRAAGFVTSSVASASLCRTNSLRLDQRRSTRHGGQDGAGRRGTSSAGTGVDTAEVSTGWTRPTMPVPQASVVREFVTLIERSRMGPRERPGTAEASQPCRALRRTTLLPLTMGEAQLRPTGKEVTGRRM